jgi:hypothetical protein
VVSTLHFFAPATSANCCGQPHFLNLWILWKIRPEFHTRKPLIQNSKQALSQQTPQTLLTKPHIHPKYSTKITTDKKVVYPRPILFVLVSFLEPSHFRRDLFWLGSQKPRRAQLRISPKCRITDKPCRICCPTRVLGQGVL